MKIPGDVQKVVKALPLEKRRRVEAIVRRHVDACNRMGVDVEYIDRIWIEAVESIDIEEKFPELSLNDKWPRLEPARRYDVYVNPRANW